MVGEKVKAVAIQTAKRAVVGAIIGGALYSATNLGATRVTDVFIEGAMLGAMVGGIFGAIFAADNAKLDIGGIMLAGTVTGLITGMLFAVREPEKLYMVLVGAGVGAAAWPIYRARVAANRHVQSKIAKWLRDKHLLWPIIGAIFGIPFAYSFPMPLLLQGTFGHMRFGSWLALAIGAGLILGIVIEAIIITIARIRESS